MSRAAALLLAVFLAAVGLWLAQRWLWRFDFTEKAHWAYALAAWRGEGAPLRLGFVASFAAAAAVAAPPPEAAGPAPTPPARAAAGHMLAVNAARERGFYAHGDPAAAPGFAAAGVAAGRILLVAPFDQPGRWRDQGASWRRLDGEAEIPSPIRAAIAALDAFETAHGTALEALEVYMIEAVVLITAGRLENAPALAAEAAEASGSRLVLAGLAERGDGLARLEASILPAESTRAVPDDLASYARRAIA